MRKSRVILLGLAGAAILPTLAGATEQNVNLSANVVGFCTFSAPTIPASANITPGILTPTASTVTLTTPTNALGIMQSWLFTMAINGTCNKVANVKLTSQNGGLKDSAHPPGPAPSGFIKRFDYTASVSFDGAPPALLLPTNGTPGVTSIPSSDLTTGPFTGTATLHVNGLPDVSSPLIAGNYSDTLTLSLIPQ
jgi:hypothetical protein